MPKTSQQSQKGHRSINIEAGCESDRRQKGKQFSRRDLHEVEQTLAYALEQTHRQLATGVNTKGRSGSDPCIFNELNADFKSLRMLGLQRGLDFESPGFQKRLGNVLGVLIPACPLPQARRAQVLVGRELIFAHNLLKLSNGRDNGADRLRLAPVGISASLGHEKCLSTVGGVNCLTNT